MAQQFINRGAFLNDPANTVTNVYDAADLIQRNFTELYGRQPPYLAGNWYPTAIGAYASGTAVPANSMRMYPMLVRRDTTLAALGARVQTAGTNMQIAVYASDAAGAPTGAPIAVTASIDATGSASTRSGAIVGGNVALPSGLYWVALNVDNAATVLQVTAGASNNTAAIRGSSSLANLTSGAAVGSLTYTFAQTFGTWPNMTGQTLVDNTSTTWGLIFMQVA